MLNAVVASILKYIIPRLTSWFAGMTQWLIGKKQLEGKQKERLELARRIQSLRREFIASQARGEDTTAKQEELLFEVRKFNSI